jgi:transposase
MSLNAPLFYVIPEETIQVAQAVFPKGNRYLRVRDTFGPLFENPAFAHLFSHTGQPAEDPARLALVTVLQFAERLSDEQAADAVRSRIDWKYLLALPLRDAGFDPSVLSEFRTRLVEGNAEELLFDTLLTQCRAQGLLRPRGRQRSDSTHVLAAVRALNRLECVGTVMRHALNCLAVVAPDWLLAHSHPDWLERYGSRMEDYRLPESKDERVAFATVIGADGVRLLQAITATDAPDWLRTIPAVQTLRQVWIQNYTWSEHERLRWRTNDEIPPSAQYIGSPYDLDARYSQKRSTSWVGYKVHLTESCEADLPHLITNVETTIATTPDDAVTAQIHESLKQHDLLPDEHIVDMGYIDAELLVDSERRYQVDLFGPVRGDYRRQGQENKGFAAADFVIDWEAQQARCPAGCTSINWNPTIDLRENPVIRIKFAMRDCQACAHRSDCTDGKRRCISIRPRAQYQALQQRRKSQRTKSFKDEYAKRAGVEGTISQGVRRCDIRHARYRGLPKTRLQHLATAAALNLVRVADWLDETPHAKTRHSTFERLYRQAQAA